METYGCKKAINVSIISIETRIYNRIDGICGNYIPYKVF